MLKDITLGQFFPGKSPIHRMDPRTKLILTVVYIVALFLATKTKLMIQLLTQQRPLR